MMLDLGRPFNDKSAGWLGWATIVLPHYDVELFVFRETLAGSDLALEAV
jgi:hypothetical protein